jgi:hypothetical protein
MFYGAIVVGDGECGWPDGFCGTGRAGVDTFEGKSSFAPPSEGVFVAINTRKCCDLGAHGERSAWLAAKKTLKRNPAGRVRLDLEELRVEHQFLVAWFLGDLCRSPGQPSGAGQRAERALPEAAVA